MYHVGLRYCYDGLTCRVRLLKLETHTHTHRECLLSDEILQVRVHGKSVLVSEAQGEIGILHSDTGHRRYSPRSIGLGVVVGINATLFLVATHNELVVGAVGESGRTRQTLWRAVQMLTQNCC